MRGSRSTLGTLLRLSLSCGPLLLGSGCSLPSMNVIPNMPQAPTVSILQQHLQCLIVRAMDRHLGPDVANKDGGRKTPDYVRWHNLVDYNVLDSINFTVFVTQTQGLNPSMNFITPLTNLGGPIKNVIESSDGTNTVANAASNMNNFTLSVGFNLSGTQDRNYVLNYIIDLHRLYDATFQDVDGQIQYVASDPKDPNPLHRPPHDVCGGPSEPGAEGSHYGLRGDLAVEATIADGLTDLDSATFSPNTAGGAPAKGGQTTATAAVSQSASATGFSQKVDFSLQWGVNGGPSWTLLRIKGPGGGSGANGQLLSYTRQKQDTLISTLSATCKSDDILHIWDLGKLEHPDLFADVVLTPAPPPPLEDNSGVSPFAITMRARTPIHPGVPASGPEPVWRDFLISLAIQKDTNRLPLYSISNAVGAISITSPSAHGPDTTEADGTISWSGYANVDYNKADKNDVFYSLRGLIADAQSGTGLGYVYIGIQTYKDGTRPTLTTFHLSNNAIDSLVGETRFGPPTYWDSLASCGNSGPFLANGLSILQQLPGSLSSTILQQPGR